MEDKEQRLESLKRKLAILQWDLERDQINPAIKVKYEELKQECDRLESETKSP